MELMVALAILSIVLTLSLPSFAKWQEANEFKQALRHLTQLAESGHGTQHPGLPVIASSRSLSQYQPWMQRVHAVCLALLVSPRASEQVSHDTVPLCLETLPFVHV